MKNDPTTDTSAKSLSDALRHDARAANKRVIEHHQRQGALHAKRVQKVERRATGGGKHPLGATRKRRDPIAARKRRKMQRMSRRANR